MVDRAGHDGLRWNGVGPFRLGNPPGKHGAYVIVPLDAQMISLRSQSKSHRVRIVGSR